MQPKIPSEITQSRLKELLNYDPETGIFTWRVSTNNRTPAGSVAGTLRPDGYTSIMLDRRRHLAHRLAFLYLLGAWPVEHVDHMNGIRDDNRWVNLRPVTRSQNSHNIAGPGSQNTSGFLGVSWCKQRGKWESYIKLNSKKRHLGLFATREAAHAAYLAAKDHLHPTHLRLRQAA